MPRPLFILNQLDAAREALEKAGFVCEFRRSRRNVPMILVEAPDGEVGASVCYFGKTHVFRCFHPWMAGPQEKFTSAAIEDIVRHVKGILS